MLASWYSCSLLRSRSGRSHVTLPVPTRLLQTDIHSFLGVLRFCLLGPMSLSFTCHCIRCTNHRREHSQESHTLIGSFPRKECMSVWSSRVGTGSVTWLRPERLQRRLVFLWTGDISGIYVALVPRSIYPSVEAKCTLGRNKSQILQVPAKRNVIASACIACRLFFVLLSIFSFSQSIQSSPNRRVSDNFPGNSVFCCCTFCFFCFMGGKIQIDWAAVLQRLKEVYTNAINQQLFLILPIRSFWLFCEWVSFFVVVFFSSSAVLSQLASKSNYRYMAFIKNFHWLSHHGTWAIIIHQLFSLARDWSKRIALATIRPILYDLYY